jgi:hypothetical protein
MKETIAAIEFGSISKVRELLPTFVGDGGALFVRPSSDWFETFSKISPGMNLQPDFGEIYMSPSIVNYEAFAWPDRKNLRSTWFPKWTLPSPITPDVEKIFAELVGQWYSLATGSSDIAKRMLNEPFLQIIGLGEPAIPYILEELKKEPSILIEALRAITRCVVVGANDMTFEEEINKWVQWGQESGYL